MHPILDPDPRKADGLRNNIGMRRERLPAGTGQLPGVEEKKKRNLATTVLSSIHETGSLVALHSRRHEMCKHRRGY